MAVGIDASVAGVNFQQEVPPAPQMQQVPQTQPTDNDGTAISPTAAKEKLGFDTSGITKAALNEKANAVAVAKLDPVSEAKLAKANPELAGRIRAMAADLKAQGISFRVTDGVRTFAEQDALYSQGRTKPGNIVTKVKGGGSFHNYGLAVDIVPLDKNGKANYNVGKDVWNKIGVAGQKQGLNWGGAWKGGFVDQPHFQMDGGKASARSYLDTYNKEGLQGVWDEVNKNTKPANGLPTTPTAHPTNTTTPTTPAHSTKPTTPNLPVPTAHLEKGAKGTPVKQLQNALVKLGYLTQAQMNTGPGTFGPRTATALRRFQQGHSLKVDGIYGAKTQAALRNALGGAKPAQPTNPTAPTNPAASTASAAGINDILKGTNLAGKGELISQLAKKYNVPAELALAMFRMEAGFAKNGTLAAKTNNPGNIKYVGQTGTTKEGPNAKWKTMDEGIEAYFKLLDKGYRKFIDNKDWAGLINKYAPPSENDTNDYVKNIKNWMADYRKRING